MSIAFSRSRLHFQNFPRAVEKSPNSWSEVMSLLSRNGSRRKNTSAAAAKIILKNLPQKQIGFLLPIRLTCAIVAPNFSMRQGNARYLQLDCYATPVLSRKTRSDVSNLWHLFRFSSFIINYDSQVFLKENIRISKGAERVRGQRPYKKSAGKQNAFRRRFSKIFSHVIIVMLFAALLFLPPCGFQNSGSG